MRRSGLTIASVMAMVLVFGLVFGALRNPTFWMAGLVLLMTLGLLTLGILGVVYRRGGRRAFWLGATLFGWGYLALVAGPWWNVGEFQPVLPTTLFLERVMPTFSPATIEDPWLFRVIERKAAGKDETGAILEMLDRPISMPFRNETPLEDVILHIKSATRSPDLPNGIPIYLDPIGLQEAEKSEATPVQLNLEGVPLRRSLKLMLRQLDLDYHVGGGLLTITSLGSLPDREDPEASFLQVGHCLFALLAAILGGLAGRAMHATADPPRPA